MKVPFFLGRTARFGRTISLRSEPEEALSASSPGVEPPGSGKLNESEVEAAGNAREVDLRKNVAAVLIDGVGWPLGQSFVSPQTILPLFIALLSRSSFVVGLVVAVQSVGMILPQLFVANRLEHMRIKRIYIVVIGVVMERIPFLILAIATVLLNDHTALLLLFFGCWTIANFGTGLNMPAYLGLFAKIIPARLRGRLGGIGNAAGMLLGVGGAYVTTRILASTTGFTGFSVIFVIGFIILTISLFPLGVTDEPPSAVAGVRTRTRDYLAQIPTLLRGNRPFARYLAFQVALQLAYSAPPFITAYAVLKLGVSTATVGVFTGLLMGANALGSVVLGPIADRHGYRWVFVVSAVLATAAFAALAFLPPLAVVYVCVAGSGVVLCTQFMGNNMAMEYCPPDKAGTYTAIVTTAGSPVRILGPLALGFIADRAGMTAVFVIVAFFSVLALYLMLFRVSDPRAAGNGG